MKRESCEIPSIIIVTLYTKTTKCNLGSWVGGRNVGVLTALSLEPRLPEGVEFSLPYSEVCECTVLWKHTTLPVRAAIAIAFLRAHLNCTIKITWAVLCASHTCVTMAATPLQPPVLTLVAALATTDPAEPPLLSANRSVRRGYQILPEKYPDAASGREIMQPNKSQRGINQ